jgi:hypothetical protein
MRQKQCAGPKFIAGAAIVSLGLAILCGNLIGVATRLSDLLGAAPGDMPNLLPMFLAWALRSFADCMLHDLLPVLAFFWPLLLVLGGTILLVHSYPVES